MTKRDTYIIVVLLAAFILIAAVYLYYDHHLGLIEDRLRHGSSK